MKISALDCVVLSDYWGKDASEIHIPWNQAATHAHIHITHTSHRTSFCLHLIYFFTNKQRFTCTELQ